jgi:hypothetical protein
MSILKTIVYSILFLILSPGFLINLYPGPKGYLLSGETSYVSILIHTLLLAFIIVTLEDKKLLDLKFKNILTHLNRIESRELISVVTILLFVLLSPGLLLTIPSGPNGFFLSKETSHLAIFIHTIIFIFVFGISVDIIDRNRSILKI